MFRNSEVIPARIVVSAYVPDAGDIVFLNFDPQVGWEQCSWIN